MKIMARGFWLAFGVAVCLCVFQGNRPAHASSNSPEIVSWRGAGGVTLEAAAGELLVKFRDGTTAEARSQVNRSLSGEVIRTIPRIDVSVVKLPEGMSLEDGIKAYSQRPEVAYAEPNLIVRATKTANDTYYSQLEHLPIIHAPEAWDLSTGEQEVVIAIIDTGVMVDHPDLKDNIWVNEGEIAGNKIDDDGNGYVDDVNGYDFVQNDGDPSPKDNAATATAGGGVTPQFVGIAGMDHGTHVAGLAAAVGNNGVGVTGVCWKASIMAVRVLGMNGAGTIDAIASGIVYAADNGAKVENMSLGGYGTTETANNAVAYALSKDVVVVAGAGNDNVDIDVTPFYPCSIEGVVGVASTNQQDQKSDFSNYGAKNVDVSAPGGNGAPEWTLLSTSFYVPNDPSFGDPYGLAAGTSMATPVVAGTAALIRAFNPVLTRVEVADVLTGGADNIDSQNPNYLGKLGAGRVSGLGALLMAKPAPKIGIVFPTADTVSYSVTPMVIGSVRKAFSRAPEVDTQSIVLRIDGRQVFSSATDSGFDAATGELNVVVSALSQGRHTLTAEASDVAGNTADPVSISFRVDTLVLGQGWQMFSVPHILTRTDPVSVLGEPSPRLARWGSDGTPSFSGAYHLWSSGTADPFVASLSPGRAYWVDNSQETPLRIEGGTVPFADFYFTEEYPTGEDALRPGWHQIGTPFPFAAAAGNLVFDDGVVRLPAGDAVNQGWVGRTLYWYTSRGYQWSVLKDAVMEPFVGYWIKTLVPCRISIPPLITSSSRSPGPAATARNATEGWQARLTVSAGSYVDEANVFGVAPGASDGRDAWDVEKPPMPGISAGFVRGEGTYAQELLSSAGQAKNWEFRVKTSLGNENVRIQWDDLRAVPRNIALVFTDLATGKRVFMRTSGDYAYQSGPDGGERRFRITAQGLLGGLRLGPVGVQETKGDRVAISVSVTQPALTTVEILGLNGALLRRVADREAVVGATVFYWDGRDERGTLLPGGSYLCEVRAETEDGEKVSAVTSFTHIP